MTLNTAKGKIKKARETLAFAIRKGLPHSNYPANALARCTEKMDGFDADALRQWYDNTREA